MEYFSHIGQDRLVAEIFGFKNRGYFLDFGTFDGITTSNTLFLERLGWKGICVEPNPTFYAKACEVRRCITINSALWPISRQSIEFCDAHGLSSLQVFKESDSNAEKREQATQRKIMVDTINPTELLIRFDAPRQIDYLSLDVEGAELDVVRSLDLDLFNISLMTIEHNHHAQKKAEIRNYLTRRGFEVLELRNDDFFFNRAHLMAAGAIALNPEDAHALVMREYGIRTP